MQLKISTPCPVSWDSLVGNDRIRACAQCGLNVYNLAAMSPSELEQVVRKTEGRLCGRLYVREDRTATASECPRAVVRKRIRAALAVAAALLIGGLAWGLASVEKPRRTLYPAWVQSVLEWIDPTPKQYLMGKVSCPPPKSPSLPSLPE